MSFSDVFNMLGSKAGQSIKGAKGFEDKHLVSPADVFRNSLKLTSGTAFSKTANGVFYQIVGFRAVCDGYGSSLLLANTAIALAEKGLKVCVVDTSILRPVQDVYLKTGVRTKNPKEVLDWFDLPLTKKSVLGVSSVNKNINVLCFTNRTIVDALSSSDTEELVTMAFKQLESRYDIILVDICNEPTSVATTAMTKVHTVFQVWSNDVQCLNSLPSFIKNVTTLACTVDKLKYVITSSVIEDIKTDWSSVLGKYGFKHLASTPFSMDIARVSASGSPIWGYPSNADGIVKFNNAIAIICNKILGSDVDLSGGTLSVDDVVNGKVEGTTTYNLAHPPKEVQDFYDTVDKDTENALKEMEYLEQDSDEDFDLFAEQPTVTENSNKGENNTENGSKLGRILSLFK